MSSYNYLSVVSYWNNRWSQPCSGTANTAHDYRNDMGSNTTATPGVNSTGGCTTPSGANALGWGPLDGSWLAMTCTWYNAFGQITNADIRFDTSDRNWTVYDELLDANTWSFDSVAVHELGHAAGLDHINDSTQVMYPYINGGQKKTLIGTGDKAGIAAMYGIFDCNTVPGGTCR